jgi:hypothetical protein
MTDRLQGAALLEFVRQKCYEDGDCWRWSGYLHSGGPRLKIAGHWYQVRRLLGNVTGPKRAGMICGQVDCVAPHHIVGRTRSQVEKAKPMTASRLVAYATVCERHANSKLDRQKATEARRLFRDGMPQTAIAARMGVSQQCIGSVVNNRSWREASPWAI